MTDEISIVDITKKLKTLVEENERYKRVAGQYAEVARKLTEVAKQLNECAKELDPYASASSGTKKRSNTPYEVIFESLSNKLVSGAQIDTELILKTYGVTYIQAAHIIKTLRARIHNLKTRKEGRKIILYME